jgi:hypothetical protein
VSSLFSFIQLAIAIFLGVDRLNHVLTACRYAIDDASADWSAAKAQVWSKLAVGGGRGTSTVVSVKTSGFEGQKRKADTATGAPDTKTKKNRRSLTRKK